MVNTDKAAAAATAAAAAAAARAAAGAHNWPPRLVAELSRAPGQAPAAGQGRRIACPIYVCVCV